MSRTRTRVTRVAGTVAVAAALAVMLPSSAYATGPDLGVDIGQQVNLPTTVDISHYSTPVSVDPSQDPTTIQPWDVVENPLAITPAHDVLSISDAQSDAVAGDGGSSCYGWRYDPDTAYGARSAYRRRGDTWTLNNYSGSTGRVEIEKAQEVSVSVTLSASAEVEAGVILSKVKATFGVSVTGSIKWTTSTTYGMNVGAWKMGHLTGGAWGYTTRGRYYHQNSKCQVDIDHKVITAFTPKANDHSYAYWEEAAVPVE